MRAHLGRHLVFVIAWSLEGHAQQILLHDGFEAPSVAGHALNLSGPFTFGVWSGVAASHGGNAGVVVGADNGLAPAEGVQHFAFNGGNPSDRTFVETNLSGINPDLQLTLGFALGRGGAIGQLLHARVQVWQGTSLLLEEIAIPAQANVYSWFDFDFVTGSSEPLRIRFEDVSGPNQVSDLWLDDVTLTLIGGQMTDNGGAMSAVPEPSDWAEFAGFGVLAWAARRKRRKPKAGLNTEGAEVTETQGAECVEPSCAPVALVASTAREGTGETRLA